jgi:hypothetical protein
MPQNNDAASRELEALCVLDAVICVHFAGANLQRLLVDVLREARLVLMVPQEVHEEVLGKARKYPGLGQRWLRLTGGEHVRILPALQAATASPRVVEVLEEVRGLQFEQALRRPEDLGEAVVVAHGVEFQERGHEVYVAIDDQGGQASAALYGLTVLTMEQVLELAVAFGRFTTEGDLKAAYAKLRAYGDGLVEYHRTALPVAYKAWRSGGS